MPSNLHYAAAEIDRIAAFRLYGRVTGVLLAGYGVARSLIEFVREPDAQIGLLLDSVSMGQLLSVPMIIFGVYLIRRKPSLSGHPPV